MNLSDLPTPALVIDADALAANIATMSSALPGPTLRPHVKAHKCTALAAQQALAGHRAFTCATPREVIGMAAAGLGDDLLLANETLDPVRLAALAAVQQTASVTVAVDSPETIDAAATAGIAQVVIDVAVGLPRCGCAPGDAGRLADLARRRGLTVRGVMGYEGHLMMVSDPDEQHRRVEASMELLIAASAEVGADVAGAAGGGGIVSAGGTGTYRHHTVGPGGVTEVQAGSYALMDSHYATLALPFVQAAWVLGTVISVSTSHAVADVGLKALGMDHGNPSLDGSRGPGGTVWFLSDEHVTFVPDRPVALGERVHLVPAHIDPTMAMHEVAWLARGDEVLERWPIDLRAW